MRVSKEQAAGNRGAVVEAEARQFREREFDGVGIDTIMARAGLTHGFYRNFRSKAELIAEACTRAFAQIDDFWGAMPRGPTRDCRPARRGARRPSLGLRPWSARWRSSAQSTSRSLRTRFLPPRSRRWWLTIRRRKGRLNEDT